MKITQSILPTVSIQFNTGQYPGVPRNPRQIDKKDFDTLCTSISDNPEMLALRELLVVPHCGKYVCLCGNMRLRALQTLGVEDAPCKIIEDTEPAKLRRIALKDNVEAGEWDIEEMLKSWSIEELTRFGLKDIETKAAALNPDDLSDEFSLPDADEPAERKITVKFTETQAVAVRLALKREEEQARRESIASGNKDLQACAFYLITKLWAEQKKSK